MTTILPREAVRPPAIERRTASFSLEETDELRFRGHAAVFNRWSEDLGGFREQIRPGAFAGVLTSDVRLLIGHQSELVLARTTVASGPGSLRLAEDDTGLVVDATLAPTTYAKDLRTLVKTGVVTQMSFGFTMRGGDEEWSDGAELAERTLVRVGGLFDVSAVTFPAYADTDAQMRSAPRLGLAQLELERLQVRLRLLAAQRGQSGCP